MLAYLSIEDVIIPKIKFGENSMQRIEILAMEQFVHVVLRLKVCLLFLYVIVGPTYYIIHISRELTGKTSISTLQNVVIVYTVAFASILK